MAILVKGLSLARWKQKRYCCLIAAIFQPLCDHKMPFSRRRKRCLPGFCGTGQCCTLVKSEDGSCLRQGDRAAFRADLREPGISSIVPVFPPRRRSFSMPPGGPIRNYEQQQLLLKSGNHNPAIMKPELKFSFWTKVCLESGPWPPK